MRSGRAASGGKTFRIERYLSLTNRHILMLRHFKALRPSTDALIILSLAVANVLFHMLVPEYGYHRDEMYYVAIADVE